MVFFYLYKIDFDKLGNQWKKLEIYTLTFPVGAVCSGIACAALPPLEAVGMISVMLSISF